MTKHGGLAKQEGRDRPVLGEKFLKLGDYPIFDERTRASEYPSDTNFCDFPRQSLIKGWIDRKIGVILYCRADLGITGHGTRNYLITFDPPAKSFVTNNGSLPRYSQLDIGFVKHGGGNRKGPMLVPIVNGLELPQETRFRQFSAMIGLYTFDGTQHAARDSIKRRTFLGLKPVTGAAQRELYILLLCGGGGLSQCKNKVVKCGAQLVGDFPDQNAVGDRERLDIAESRDKPAILVLLKRNSVEVIFDESVGNRIEFISSGARPTNLLTNRL